MRAGGLEIRITAQLAPSAFLASATSCSQLVHQILSAFPLDISDRLEEAALNLWREGHSHLPPDHPASYRQRCWDSPKVDAEFNSLLETANTLSKARRSFFKEVARRSASLTGDPQPHQFLMQRVVVAVQRGNAASILGSSVASMAPFFGS